MSLSTSLPIDEPIDEPQAKETTGKRSTKAKEAPAPKEQPVQPTPLEEAIARTRTARPMGKSRNPEFTQIGAYIRKTTKKATELRLMQEEGEQDLSDLIESLLAKWLAH